MRQKQKFVQNNLDKGTLKLGSEINVLLMVDADLAHKSTRSCYCPGLLRPLSAANLKWRGYLRIVFQCTRRPGTLPTVETNI